MFYGLLVNHNLAYIGIGCSAIVLLATPFVSFGGFSDLDTVTLNEFNKGVDTLTSDRVDFDKLLPVGDSNDCD